ncbi:DUF6701 domain-containing protein [Paraglaciecola agarilytica]|uniref:DUF6701 domain-containing protein n=1 Tax=Paraglaciecola chathamensis TaxID=368405 RepID=UPI00235480D2|nr:DUF6701 domain-containing protein [Paraglaciecola agarilytica]|tara:strand:- start:26390 stop:30970 length:4581 start_codon:yes stop_codon:yes gene_type:complete
MKSPLLSAIFLIVFLFPVSALANTMCTDLLSEEAVGDITDSGGENRDYANFENCGFLIRPETSGNIVLSFTDFQYESGYDTLTVYDGSDASAPQLGRFTGGDLPDSITSTSGAMFIVHNSDQSIVGRGFSATWRQITRNSCNAETFTVGDHFPQASYGNSTGARNWTSNWREVNENDGVSQGVLRVTNTLCTNGNCMRLGIISSSGPRSYSGRFLYRTLDLSDAVSAQLTFNYRTGYITGSSTVRLGISTDGGQSWHNLKNYSVSSTQTSANTESFDISSYVGSNVAIGFEVSGSNSVAGFYMDDLEVTATEEEICDGPPLAFYQFEQASWSGNGSITDSSSSSYDGSPVGDIFPQYPSEQKSCQVMSVPNNTRSDVSSAIDTGLRVDNEIGKKGTISFWYRSNQSWQSGTRRQLFDASTWLGSNGDSRFFYLSLGSGNLDFGLEDSTDADGALRVSGLSFAAQEWVHVAVSYDYSKDSAAIFINGRQRAQTNNLGLNGQAPVFDTLYVGDNRSRYKILNMTENSANGEFDDLRIYDYSQSSDQVNTDLNNVSPCQVEPYAVYEFEQAEFDGIQSILDSTDNARHASPVGNIASVLSTEQISCRFTDIPFNNSANSINAINTGIAPDDMGSAGTISFWYRSNEAWSSGTSRQLFDASTNIGNTNSKYFYLSLRSSRLYFGLEDLNDRDAEVVASGLNFAAQQWVHIAVSYDYAAKTAVIYVNGREAGRSNSLNLNSGIAQFNSLYIGDNRTTYIVTNMSRNSANGQFDNVRLNAFVQNSSQINTDMGRVSTCQAISHYQIEHDGQGLTCEAETVTIKACANESCSELYTEQSALSITPGTWGAGDPLVFTGSLENTPLSVLDPSTFNFGKSSAAPDVPLRCVNTGSGAQDCSMTFVDAGFEFVGTDVADKFLPDQLAELNFSGANLRAVQNTNGVCQALLQGQQEITLGVNCTSPNRCETNFSGIDTSTNPSGESTGSVRLTFDANGIASLDTLSYADAGRVGLRAEAQINGVTITSGTTSVDVVPAHLQLSVAPTALVYTDNNFSVYPSVVDPDVYPAGEEFTFTITAYGAVGDSPLANYQPGQLQIAAERMLPYEAAGADGTFIYGDAAGVLASLTKQFSNTPTLSFVGGRYDYQANYSEVGVIRLDVQDVNYLPDNNNPIDAINTDSTLTLGEFTPAYFDVQILTAPELVNQCGNFSYMGQQVTFSPSTQVELVAMNALGNVTKNYINGYWRYGPDTTAGVTIDDASIHAASSPVVTRITSEAPALITEPTAFNGITLVEVPDATFAYQKVATDFTAYPLIEPFAAAVDMRFLATFLTADNNVCYQSDYPISGCEDFSISDETGSNITGTNVNVRHGRLSLEPNFGPETDFLVTPVRAEHYLNGRWQLNQEDNCTPIDLTESAGQIVLSAQGGNDITGQIDPTVSSGTLIAGEILGNSNFALTGSASGNGPGVAGAVGVTLDPSAGNPAWAQYMNFDWNNDGYICSDLTLCPGASSIDGPSSILTFGLYRGNDRIIHWREVFN